MASFIDKCFEDDDVPAQDRERYTEAQLSDSGIFERTVQSLESQAIEREVRDIKFPCIILNTLLSRKYIRFWLRFFDLPSKSLYVFAL